MEQSQEIDRPSVVAFSALHFMVRRLNAMSDLRVEIRSSEDVVRLEKRVVAAAAQTLEALPGLLAMPNPIDAFARLRFEQIGRHPLQDRALNLVEQLNQTFTCLASLKAATWLLSRHPESAPLRLNLGTTSGSDIEAFDGSLAAETFAAVTPKNNDKLRSDIRKVSLMAARLKYVFYICPQIGVSGPVSAPGNSDVQVVSLGWVSAAGQPIDAPDPLQDSP
jgi:hypothetical protein